MAATMTGCYEGLPHRSPDFGVGTLDPIDVGSTGSPQGEGSSSGGTTGELDPVDEDGSTGAAEPGDGSSTGEPENEPDGSYIGATGIEPSGLYVNQGIAITLAEGGQELPVDLRTAGVVHGRRTLVFATWTTAPSFVPRTIRAELHLSRATRAEETLVSEVFVDGPSGPGALDSHFEWTLQPEQIPEGTTWSVTLHETEFDPEAFSPDGAPRLPAFGQSLLDDEDGVQRMRVVLIPYRHQYGGCERVAPHDAATLEAYRRRIESMYPTQEVEITLHPERTFTSATAGLDSLLTDVVDVRAAEAPAPDIYYYGLIYPCDEPTSGGLGYVPHNPGTTQDAPWRAAVGVHFDFAPAYAHDTAVHELGHNHGRKHVACAGNEGETDPNYPIPNGKTGVLGWGIHDGLFRDANATDYMTYCENYWVSTYAWNATLHVIDALSLAVGAGPTPPSNHADDRPESVALVVRDGHVTSATHIEGLAPVYAHGTARWQMRDGGTVTAVAQLDQVPDSDASFFTVALPDSGIDEVLALELDIDATTIVASRASIITDDGP